MCRVSSGTQDPSETQRKLGVWCPRGDSVPREKHRKAFPWKQEFSWVQEEHVGHCAVDLRLVVTSSQYLGLKLRFMYLKCM